MFEPKNNKSMKMMCKGLYMNTFYVVVHTETHGRKTAQDARAALALALFARVSVNQHRQSEALHDRACAFGIKLSTIVVFMAWA
jgi:hypothetical protein